MKPLVTTSLALAAILALTVTGNAETIGKRERQKPSHQAVYDDGAHGLNRTYQPDPHTRIYVSQRSWQDGGTEVLPGDRKFSDYAFPPGTSFANQNNNRPLDREPLSSASDVGEFQQRIPISR